MKRPEGFGGSSPPSAPARGAASPSPTPGASRTDAPQRKSKPNPQAAPNPVRQPAPRTAPQPRSTLARPAASRTVGSRTAADRAAAEARAAEQAAARARRREERAEVRRFTRRSRRRRQVVAAAVATSVLLVGGVAVVTLSPLMALDTVQVIGTERLDPAEVAGSLDGHLGTPLALLDETGIRDDLAAFPLIRSYTTEVVPPHTLVVRVIERVPIAVVERGAVVELVDAAGVVVERVPERPEGIPLIAPASADVDSLAFESVAAVLTALPADLRARVDVITASTRDDVAFSMTGAGHRVVWGSAERSALKARVLAAAIATTDQSRAWEYDVSAPETLVVRRL